MNKSTISNKDLRTLTKAGWVQNPGAEGYWFDPTIEMDVKKQRGGHGTDGALEIIEERSRWSKGLSVFRVTRSYNGNYGYSVTQIKPDKSTLIVYRNPDQSVCVKAAKSFTKTNGFMDFDGDNDHTQVYAADNEAIEVDEYNVVLIVREKHGNYYFYVPTFKSLMAAAYEIVTRRIEEDCWYYLDEAPKEPEFSEDSIKKLPTENIRQLARKTWADYRSELKEHKGTLEQIELIKKVKKGDKRAALKLISLRKYYQYEGYELEDMEYIEE